jgi:hypothetical protein
MEGSSTQGAASFLGPLGRCFRDYWGKHSFGWRSVEGRYKLQTGEVRISNRAHKVMKKGEDHDV